MAFYKCPMEIWTKEFSVLENSFHSIFLFMESFVPETFCQVIFCHGKFFSWNFPFPGTKFFSWNFNIHGIFYSWNLFSLNFLPEIFFHAKKFTENSCSRCEENEMVFVSHEVPFPAMSDRRSCVAENGTEEMWKTILNCFHQPVEVNNELSLSSWISLQLRNPYQD